MAIGHIDTDRLSLLEEYVQNGGALGMIGGYLSFTGKGGLAQYGTMPVGDVLPVEISRHDDRIETPSGVRPEASDEVKAVADLPEQWPAILGYNRFVADEDAEVWATVGEDPFLVVGEKGDGYTRSRSRPTVLLIGPLNRSSNGKRSRHYGIALSIAWCRTNNDERLRSHESAE